MYKSILTEEEKKELFHWEERVCQKHGRQRHLVSSISNIGMCGQCSKEAKYKPSAQALERIKAFQEQQKSFIADNPFPELPSFDECLENIKGQQ